MAQSKTQLVVVAPFGDYAVGAVITDDATMKAVLAGDSAGSVVATPAPADPDAKKS